MLKFLGDKIDKRFMAGFSVLAILSVSGYFYYKGRNITPTPKP